MDTDKIQPVLLDEMKRLREDGRPDARLRVVVSVKGTGEGRPRDLSALEHEARTAQADLRRRLDAMGVTDYASLTLANAIEVELTVDQIGDIAGEATVKAIVWNRLERVTTSGGHP